MATGGRYAKSFFYQWSKLLTEQKKFNIDIKNRIKLVNPQYIPRNHLIESALKNGVDGDMTKINLIVFFTGILTNFYFTSLGQGFVSFLICLAVLSAIKFLADYILKNDSFGWGDIILISNLALFFGIYNLPFILFVSSLSGIIWYFFKKRNVLEKTIAFGPHIALSGIWLLFIL